MRSAGPSWSRESGSTLSNWSTCTFLDGVAGPLALVDEHAPITSATITKPTLTLPIAPSSFAAFLAAGPKPRNIGAAHLLPALLDDERAHHLRGVDLAV